MEYSDNKFDRGSVTIIIVSPNERYILQHRDNIKGIEYPGYWSLIAGWIEYGETPMDAIERELREELTTTDGSSLMLGEIIFLGSCARKDRPWTEYVFYVKVHNSIETLKILEGQGIDEFTLEECCKLEKLAPHHKNHIIKYCGQVLTKINIQ